MLFLKYDNIVGSVQFETPSPPKYFKFEILSIFIRLIFKSQQDGHIFGEKSFFSIGTLLQRKVGTSEKVMSHHSVTDHRGNLFPNQTLKLNIKMKIFIDNF